MSSKAEDFPTPVSPTRRIVTPALFLMIPCLRDARELEDTVRRHVLEISRKPT
jgi:hypothetical protein